MVVAAIRASHVEQEEQLSESLTTVMMAQVGMVRARVSRCGGDASSAAALPKTGESIGCSGAASGDASGLVDEIALAKATASFGTTPGVGGVAMPLSRRRHAGCGGALHRGRAGPRVEAVRRQASAQHRM